MRENFKIKKRAIVLLLALLIAADIALGAYTWNLASAEAAQHELTLMMRNRDLLKKDIQRARDIRSHIPAIQKDCDSFEQSLFPESTAYSAISAELDSLAGKSGLHLDSRALKPKAVKGHDLTELDIDPQVSGDYPGLLRFLHSLQHSTNYYAA